MTPFFPMPSALAAYSTFGLDMVHRVALSAISCDSAVLKVLIARIWNPSFVKSGIAVNSCINPFLTSVCLILDTVGWEVFRIFDISLSLRLESFSNSERSLFIFFLNGCHLVVLTLTYCRLKLH